MDFDDDVQDGWRHNLVPQQFQRQLIAAAHMTDSKSDNPTLTRAIRIAAIDSVVEQLRKIYPHRFRK